MEASTYLALGVALVSELHENDILYETHKHLCTFGQVAFHILYTQVDIYYGH